MDINQLKSFSVLAKIGHMTNAAETLNISQSSLSQSIAKLEKELGVLLFDRKGRGVILNEYGRSFLKYTEAILKTLDEAKSELELMEEAKNNTLRIKYWTSSSMVPEMLVSFAAIYPYIKLQTCTGSTNYDFSFSFSSYDKPPEEMYEILLQEEICIAVPLSHPLAKYDSIDLKALERESFINVSNSLPFRKMTDGFCEMVGFEPTIILENEDYRTLEHLLNLGVGISFWPKKSWCHGSAEKHYKLLSITSPSCIRTIYLSWPENLRENKATELFRTFTKDYFKCNF